MNKIFIDCGGNNGCSVRKFRKLYDPNCEIKIYSFEVNPIFFDCYKDFKNHELIKKLVWIEDSVMDFYTHNCQISVGSTIFKEKVDYDNNNGQYYTQIKTESIDFSSWLKNNFTLEDKIALKLDIEGAEYKVLSKMIQDKSINLIKKLFLEWHWNYIDMTIDEHNSVVDEVKKYISVKDWDAMDCF